MSNFLVGFVGLCPVLSRVVGDADFGFSACLSCYTPVFLCWSMACFSPVVVLPVLPLVVPSFLFGWFPPWLRSHLFVSLPFWLSGVGSLGGLFWFILPRLLMGHGGVVAVAAVAVVTVCFCRGWGVGWLVGFPFSPAFLGSIGCVCPRAVRSAHLFPCPAAPSCFECGRLYGYATFCLLHLWYVGGGILSAPLSFIVVAV